MSGKTAVVTGAARGVGAATAVRLAEAGADLLLLDIGRDLPECPYPLGTEEQLKTTAETCRAFGVRVEARTVDVRDQEELNAAVAEANAVFGRIDLLVNNAGIVGPSGSVAHEITEQEWQLMVDVNLSGAWRAAKAVLPAMVAARAGSIVNIASTAGSVAFRLFAGYVSAKHGVVGLTKALAVDYAPFGIRVNAVSPTSVYESPAESPGMLSGVADIMNVDLSGYERTSRQLHPLGTLVYPEDVAAAVCWLGSDEAARVTGTVLSVDAGFTAR
ncbi:SDR family oxidoreductase [Streptomyces sp. NPDC051940]|uniref:SDR family oxidoreductase n=1 Tax=Streptomyces sp. NPDC051940 TaxID=3155675 RepID=UPI00343F19CE